MKRIKNLNYYQKGLLIFMTLMTLVFMLVYGFMTTKIGFFYKGRVLIPSQKDSNTLYSGKIQGQDAQFIVSKDETVVFQYGDKLYGPYRIKENPKALPQNEELTEDMTGVEVYKGQEVIFRGGVLKIGQDYLFFNENGEPYSFESDYIVNNDIELDENGKKLDVLEPSPATILELIDGPKLNHKGEWSIFLAASFICLINGLLILFSDELFRWNLSFRIKNIDEIEPSDGEIKSRYIGWAFMALMALALFIIGLR